MSNEYTVAPNFAQWARLKGVALKEDEDARAEQEAAGVVSSWDELQNKPTEFTPSAHKHKLADVTDYKAPDLSKYATINKLSSVKKELQEEIKTEVAGLVNGAPEALNTLKELSDAFGENKNGVADVLAKVGEVKASLSDYALKSELPEDHVTVEDLENVKATIPSVEGLASETFVAKKIAEVEDKIPSIPSHDELATKTEVKEAVKNVVKYEEFTYNGQTRKTVQLANYDSISGVSTTGKGHNLVMLSQWDVADFGAAGVHLNLNTVDTVTINDKDEVATVSYVDSKISEIEIPSIEGLATESFVEEKIATADHSAYALKTEVAEVVSGIISTIPSVDGLASVEYVDAKVANIAIPDVSNFATHEYVNTAKNEAIVAASGAAAATYATIDDMEKVKASIPPHDNFATKQELEALKGTIPTLPENHVSKEDLESAVANVVKYEDFTYNGEPRKTIQLDNYDNISGITTDGNGVNLAMISKWDVADFGAPSVHMNLNTKMYKLEDGSEYPAITINDKPEWAIATVEYVGQQVNAVKDSIPTIPTDHVTVEELAAALARINTLESKVFDLSKSDVVTIVAGEAISDGIVPENIDLTVVMNSDAADIVKTLNYTAKSIDVKGVRVKSAASDPAKVIIKATDGDVAVTNYQSTGVGTTNKGAEISVSSNEHVKVSNCIIGQTSYNGLEISLDNTSPKSVLIDNVKFEGKLTNNAISIFNHTENAVITISNCHFSNVSNALRISNVNNVPCIINVINCVVDSWAASSTGYSGFLICQDYSSASASDEVAINRFGNNKITVNFINCVGPNGKKFTEFGTPAEFCGTANDNQLVYVWYDKSKAMQPYGNGSTYPVINIK